MRWIIVLILASLLPRLLLAGTEGSVLCIDDNHLMANCTASAYDSANSADFADTFEWDANGRHSCLDVTTVPIVLRSASAESHFDASHVLIFGTVDGCIQPAPQPVFRAIEDAQAIPPAFLARDYCSTIALRC